MYLCRYGYIVGLLVVKQMKRIKVAEIWTGLKLRCDILKEVICTYPEINLMKITNTTIVIECSILEWPYIIWEKWGFERNKNFLIKVGSENII